MRSLVEGVLFPLSARVHISVRQMIALITCIVGLVDLLSAIAPWLNWNILQGAWPFIAQQTQTQASIVIVGFFLMMLSYGLICGKNHAWRIMLFLLLLSALLQMLSRGSILAALVALGLAALLSTLYGSFQTRSEPLSVWRGYIVLAAGLGIMICYIDGGFLALLNDFERFVNSFGFDGAFLSILERVYLLYLIDNRLAFLFQQAMPGLCICAVLYGMLQLFQPVAAVSFPHTEKRHLVGKYVRLYGINSISYFALNSDKSYFFSKSGRAVISYVLKGGVAVVAGDPIGPADEMIPILQQFMKFCQNQGWATVFWQVCDTFVPLYRAAGLYLLKIGEDAVINVQKFTLKGRAVANIRTSARRAEKDGLHVVFYQGQVTDSWQLAQMEQISSTWLTSKGGHAMGFSMGGFDPQGDDEQLTAIAVDQNNKVHAFVTFVPIYGRRGYGLDMMCRALQPAPGVMELLLVRSLEVMRSQGVAMVSLGLAPMSNANAEEETLLGNSIDYLIERFGSPVKMRSLFNFKKKFRPTWEGRYLVYSDALRLFQIGWALYYVHQCDVSPLTLVYNAFNLWLHSHHIIKRNMQAKDVNRLDHGC